MTLYLIGLGLGDEKDITLKGLEAIKRCERVYVEGYTSLLQCSIQDLEKLYGKKVIVHHREGIEHQGDDIVKEARTKDVAVLIIGDVFGATTHWDLFMRAKEQKVKVEVIHNTSILTAVGDTGLQLYKFGRVVSIPFPQKEWIAETPYTMLKENRAQGLHTLFLLDLDPKSNKFMTIKDALKIVERLEADKKEGVIDDEAIFIGCARLGTHTAVIKAGSLKDVANYDFGKPPHCLIVPGRMHFMEEEALQLWK